GFCRLGTRVRLLGPAREFCIPGGEGRGTNRGFRDPETETEKDLTQRAQRSEHRGHGGFLLSIGLARSVRSTVRCSTRLHLRRWIFLGAAFSFGVLRGSTFSVFFVEFVGEEAGRIIQLLRGQEAVEVGIGFP